MSDSQFITVTVFLQLCAFNILIVILISSCRIHLIWLRKICDVNYINECRCTLTFNRLINCVYIYIL